MHNRARNTGEDARRGKDPPWPPSGAPRGGEWKTVTAATESAEGLKQRVCANDASHIETEAIPKLTPSPSTNPTTKPTEKAKVAAPTAVKGLVYTGAEVAGVPTGDRYTLTGASARAAGDYTAVASLKDKANTTWDDGTTADKQVKWSISKALLTAAYAGEEIEANTAPALTVTITGFVNGETAATCAGYKAPTVVAPAELEAGREYHLAPSGGEAANYTFSYTAGTLKVKGSPQAANGGNTGNGHAAGTAVAGTGDTSSGHADASGSTPAGGTGSAGSHSGASNLASSTDLALATVTLEKERYTYTGKPVTPSLAVTLEDRELAIGADFTVSYADANGNEIAASDVKDAGNYIVIVRGVGSYAGATSAAFKVAKAANPLKAKATLKTVKAAKLEKKAVSMKAIAVKSAKGKVTYRKSSGSAKLTVNKKTGKVSVKKGTPKGKYSMKVKVRAAGNANYKAATKTVRVTVKVKSAGSSNYKVAAKIAKMS